MTKGHFTATIIFVCLYLAFCYQIIFLSDVVLRIFGIAGISCSSIGLYAIKRSIKQEAE